MPVNRLIVNTCLFLQANTGPGTYWLAIPEFCKFTLHTLYCEP